MDLNVRATPVDGSRANVIPKPMWEVNLRHRELGGDFADDGRNEQRAAVGEATENEFVVEREGSRICGRF